MVLAVVAGLVLWLVSGYVLCRDKTRVGALAVVKDKDLEMLLDRVGELETGIEIAINSCKDVTTLGRFTASVDPVGWVAELQEHLEKAYKG